MGWGYGINALGREVGYTVAAICDEPECAAEIDRGLAYICGSAIDGGDYGCGGFFCERHLTYGRQRCASFCRRCLANSRDGLALIRRLVAGEKTRV